MKAKKVITWSIIAVALIILLSMCGCDDDQSPNIRLVDGFQTYRLNGSSPDVFSGPEYSLETVNACLFGFTATASCDGEPMAGILVNCATVSSSGVHATDAYYSVYPGGQMPIDPQIGSSIRTNGGGYAQFLIGVRSEDGINVDDWTGNADLEFQMPLPLGEMSYYEACLVYDAYYVSQESAYLNSGQYMCALDDLYTASAASAGSPAGPFDPNITLPDPNLPPPPESQMEAGWQGWRKYGYGANPDYRTWEVPEYLACSWLVDPEDSDEAKDLATYAEPYAYYYTMNDPCAEYVRSYEHTMVLTSLDPNNIVARMPIKMNIVDVTDDQITLRSDLIVPIENDVGITVYNDRAQRCVLIQAVENGVLSIAPDDFYGDFNFDGICNGDDYGLFMKHYGKEFIGSGYDLGYDIDQDGMIDENDAVMFFENWLKLRGE